MTEGLVPTIERPTFVGWIAFVTQLPAQLFFTVWAGLFFGGFSTMLLGLRGQGPFIVFGALAFVGVPLVSCIGKKLNYARTAYKVFDDHLEFDEGFFSRNRKVIRYRDVVEVSLRQGILQRTCGLGTVYLGTFATGSSQRSNPFEALGFGNISASGVGIRDVRDPEGTYDRIRTLVDAAKT